jgi:hypothetical protein
MIDTGRGTAAFRGEEDTLIVSESMHIEESDREKSFMQEGGAVLNEEYGESTVNIESMFGAAP